jgi:hypothetical protein
LLRIFALQKVERPQRLRKPKQSTQTIFFTISTTKCFSGSGSHLLRGESVTLDQLQAELTTTFPGTKIERDDRGTHARIWVVSNSGQRRVRVTTVPSYEPEVGFEILYMDTPSAVDGRCLIVGAQSLIALIRRFILNDEPLTEIAEFNGGVVSGKDIVATSIDPTTMH